MSSKYNNIFYYYVYELSSFMLFYQFINLCLLFFFLIVLVLNFFKKKYTIKIVILFLCKRFCFIFVLFFFIYCYSDFSLCDTHINKAVGGYLDTNTKKYVAITCVTITAGFILYKYIPLFYNRVYNYNNNILSIKKYNEDLVEYKLRMKESNSVNKKILDKEQVIYTQKYIQFLDDLSQFKLELTEIYTQFKNVKLRYNNIVNYKNIDIDYLNNKINFLKLNNSNLLLKI